MNNKTSRKRKQCEGIREYFQRIDSISSRCRLCHSIYKHYGNTTNLINHMKRKHEDTITKHPLQKKISYSENRDDNDNIDIDDPDLHNVPSNNSEDIDVVLPLQSSHTSTSESELNNNDVIFNLLSDSKTKKKLAPAAPITAAFNKINSYAGIYNLYLF